MRTLKRVSVFCGRERTKEIYENTVLLAEKLEMKAIRCSVEEGKV